MKIVKATEKYEAWLADRLTIIQADLDIKHEYMAGDIFTFMRATFYRWMQIWFEEKDFKKLSEAPSVLSVGDLHTDNFGSWRDVEGRLVWGINDFDEAYPLAYTADLVRLVTGAYLAFDDGYYTIPMETISGHVLAGYKSGLSQGGGPIVLAEERPWLRELITENTKDPEKFWEKLTHLPAKPEPLPPEAQQAIERMLPGPGKPYKISERTAGVGSLGRPRYVALMKLSDANTAREAKALIASAATLQWLKNKADPDSAIYYNDILDNTSRALDPFVRAFGVWLVRRLSPDYVRLDLPSLDSELVGKVLNAMGWETANVHLGSRSAIKDVRKDLKDRGEEWLPSAANQMLEFLQDDFSEWRTSWLEQQNL